MYTFSTINDKEFEELTRDLLSKELKKRFQVFKKGRDGGIDLRFSTNTTSNSIIVQAKHLVNSKYSDLIYQLKKAELVKVKKLNPKKYILVTSQGLNPQNKDEIKKIFEPYIKSTQDIYGCDDLNSMLRDYKDVETKHYKLWMSSTNVLQNILKNAVLGRSEFSKEQIEKKTKVFVPCKTFEKSAELLNKNNFLLVTGEPGIGKTMLANMLSFNLLAKDYELITVYDIKEAEEFFDISKKQVFYFDDFLGANYYDLAIAQNRDSALVNFIERIITSNDKKLILTTRTIILNKAKKESEKIDDSNLEISKYELKIEDYNKLQKAKILYNHIFFSAIDWEMKDIFFKNKFYNEVINHRNYSPRLIEHFTDIKKVEKELNETLDIEKYKNLILDKLNNPKDIWKKSFENQISDSSKYLLISLFTIQFQNEEIIKKVYHARVDFEIKKGFNKKINQYNNSISELLDGFIIRNLNIYDSFKSHTISFYNPSLGDFLLDYFRNELQSEIVNILESAVYFEQFTYRFTTKKEKQKAKLYVEKKLAEGIFIKNFEKLQSPLYYKKDSLTIIGIISYINLFGFKTNNLFLKNKFNELFLDQKNEISDLDQMKIIEFISILIDNSLTVEYKKIYKNLIIQLSRTMNNLTDFDYFRININKIEISLLNEFLADDYFIDELGSNIHKVFNNNFESFLVELLSGDIFEKAVMVTVFENEKNNITNFSNTLNVNIPKILDNDLDFLVDVEEILYHNNRKQEKDDDINFKVFEEIEQDKKNEEKLIDALFEKCF